jgi:hypothetical protein
MHFYFVQMFSQKNADIDLLELPSFALLASQEDIFFILNNSFENLNVILTEKVWRNGILLIPLLINLNI